MKVHGPDSPLTSCQLAAESSVRQSPSSPHAHARVESNAWRPWRDPRRCADPDHVSPPSTLRKMAVQNSGQVTSLPPIQTTLGEGALTADDRIGVVRGVQVA